MSGSILVVVATGGEAGALPALPGARVAVSGIGPVSAALTTLEECLRARPRLVLNAGIAGAMPGHGINPG
ncbi:MAG TPA: futalosine hydrolase, partial [Deinococcales bacterium]|nr:futalosine hydrolase [Deinococcales bacterium]